MGINASTNRFPPDALTMFRPAGETGMSASGAGEVVLPVDIAGGYWATGFIAEPLEFAVELIVESIAGTSPTVTFEVQVATDAAFTTPLNVAVSPTVSATGRTTVMVPVEAIRSALNGSATGYMRVYAVLAGTSPVVAWNAYQGTTPIF